MRTICAATLLFEGKKEEVAAQERIVYETAAKHGGVCNNFEFL